VEPAPNHFDPFIALIALAIILVVLLIT